MDNSAERAARLAALQARIAELQGKPSPRLAPGSPGASPAGALPAGAPLLDELLGGWPRPGIAVISGPPGSGRLSLLLPAMATQTRLDRPVAVVDPGELLHPPGLVGVELERLLLVRPGPERALWAVEQLAASGVFPLVVALEPPQPGGSGQRLRRAATRGGACLALITRWQPGGVPASVRLETTGRSSSFITVRVLHRRGRPGGREIGLPAQLIAPGMIR